MPARNVPSLRHHKARGLAVVTLGGKDFFCGKFGSPESRREYDRVAGEWLAAGRPHAVNAIHGLTIAELLVRYMETRTTETHHAWVGKVVCKIGRKAGVVVRVDPANPKRVKYASAHDLRRSFGDRWAKRVMPAELKEMMRHESIETTLRYYVSTNAERTAETCWSRAPGADDAYAKAFASETCNGLGNTTPAGVALNP